MFLCLELKSHSNQLRCAFTTEEPLGWAMNPEFTRIIRDDTRPFFSLSIAEIPSGPVTHCRITWFYHLHYFKNSTIREIADKFLLIVHQNLGLGPAKL
jgi:hypothetical protein